LAKGAFIVGQDASIVAGDIHFADMQAYVASKYFRENGMRCGTGKPSAAIDGKAARSVNDCTLALTRLQNEYWPCNIVYQIPIWFNIIYRSDGVGNIPVAAIYSQLDVLNEDYRAVSGTLGSFGFDVRIQFSVAGITWTQNNTWFNDGDRTGYTGALGKDPSTYVNVYTNTASGSLGYATFPQESAGSDGDGIVINYTAFGGRGAGNPPYNQGRTLVHEMGHYLGLFHTFEGGTCSNSYGSGDLVVDTQAENVEHYDCVQTATCNTQDPIHNYMNYTPDDCMLEFTREQANRMVCSLVNYRSGLVQTVSENGGTCSVFGSSGGGVIPNALIPLLLKHQPVNPGP